MSTTLTSHTMSFGVLDHAATYSWRVRGSDASETGSWSAIGTFSTEAASGPPEAPVLSSPLHGAADIDLEPTLEWGGAADAFRVQLALDPGFAAPVLDISLATKSLEVASGVLAHASTYHWRVRGDSSFGEGAWSAASAFTTAPPPLPLPPPWNLRSASQGPTKIDLEWDASPDPRVVAYQIYLDGLPMASESEPDHAAVGLDPGRLHRFRVSALDSAGNESLGTPELGVWTAVGPPRLISLSVPVSNDSDDAEEREQGGSVTLTDDDLELTRDDNKLQLVGVRFRQVPVAQAALIQGARIQFTAAESDGGTTQLTLHGQDSSNASVFRDQHDDLSSRRKTSASVAWDPPPWTTAGASGSDQRTPELTALVQEIVDRSGWSTGNAMAFLLSGSGQRTAKAYDGASDEAAMLELEYLDLCSGDADGDGFACQADCDDADASIHPGATEICDDRDNDCDNTVDGADASDAGVWFADFDGDGYGDPSRSTKACGQPPGWVAGTSDCNDADASAFPGASEACNGRDDDCDGSTDEDYVPQVTACGIGACGATGSTSCVDGSLVDSCQAGAPAAADASCDGIDDDCDGSYDEDFPLQSCLTGQPGACGTGGTFCRAGLMVCVSDETPAPSDAVCNGLDDDCDGSVDEDYDPGSCLTGDLGVCGEGTTRCEGGDELCEADLPPQSEVCDDALDNDCDGATDFPDDSSCTSHTLSLPVGTGADDVEERITLGGSMSLGSGDLQLTEDGTSLQVLGLRFRDVDVPQGAPIVGARVQFTADEVGSVTTSLMIEGEASDDAAAFQRADGDVTSRPTTTHAVAWDPPPWMSTQASGPDQRTPELTKVLQEIVDRPGWSAGQAMALVISGSGRRTAESYEGGPDKAAILEVEYLETCDGDPDGDGFACEMDCNDRDPSVHPGASEVCGDGLDNDCDGATDSADGADGLPTDCSGLSDDTACDDGDTETAAWCQAGECIPLPEPGSASVWPAIALLAGLARRQTCTSSSANRADRKFL